MYSAFKRVLLTLGYTISVAVVVAWLAGCSVYESEDRAQFEEDYGKGRIDKVEAAFLLQNNLACEWYHQDQKLPEVELPYTLVVTEYIGTPWMEVCVDVESNEVL